MSVEVVMPQMGESITEGTVSKWLKNEGDHVVKDEPLLEISTDKVDAEVPSPASGILLKINYKDGDSVEVGTSIGTIGDESETPTNGSVGEAPTMVTAEASTTKAILSEAESPVIEAIPTNSTAPSPAMSGEAVEAGSGAYKVVMPQMGESITEGTVSKWLKAVGEKIEKDESLLEISTDKVDAEVPSPVSGTILAINVSEGETVEVGAVLALVGAEGSTPTAAPKPSIVAPAASSTPAEVVSALQPVASAITPAVPDLSNGARNGSHDLDELRRAKSSPLVRNIARKHGIDITRIPGSGVSGRVTKSDIISFIETGAAVRPQDLLMNAPRSAAPSVQAERITPQTFTSVDDRIEKMSVMRKKISEHMTLSRRTSAHVTSVYEIDMTNVARYRTAVQADFQATYGTKLSFMPFIFQAVTNAIREHRIVNAQVNGDEIIYKGDINLGMAVALDWGLIVPVIRNADTLTLAQLATTANDLADRARVKKLQPQEVQGGTFTITNPGVFGGLFGTPIINQPQVAILCVGTIEKRPKVLTSSDGDDYVAIRQMAYFALTYDHRVVDGADGERFLAHMKKFLETADFSI
jgi:pyruvate dehydrogenase E2 component (dihydrolipoamide acetyltransferase)